MNKETSEAHMTHETTCCLAGKKQLRGSSKNLLQWRESLLQAVIVFQVVIWLVLTHTNFVSFELLFDI